MANAEKLEPTAGTEELEKELMALRDEALEKKGSDAELIEKEISAIKSEIFSKVEKYQAGVQEAVEKIRQANGASVEVAEAEQSGAEAQKDIQNAANVAEKEVASLQKEYDQSDFEITAPKEKGLDDTQTFSREEMDAFNKEIDQRIENKAKQESAIEQADIDPEGPEGQKKITAAFEALPQEEKIEVAMGLQNIGFYIEENKNRFFANTFQKAREVGVAKGWLRENGSLDRFLGVVGENAKNDAELSKKKFESAEKTAMTHAASIGSAVGNITKYSRSVLDVIGVTAGAPLRYVMMGGMGFATGFGAAKEARFKNEEVLVKTRVNDIDAAAEEAWNVYENAKAGKDTVSKDDLVSAYQSNIPKDLLARLQKEPEPGTASSILQKIIRKDVESSVISINSKLEKIENNEKLTAEQKKIKQEKILNKYSKHLRDLDRAVSQVGEVDALAMGAKYGETTAKAAVAAVTVETLGLTAYKLWENIPKIMGGFHELFDGKVAVVASLERPQGISVPGKVHELSNSAIVQKGEGIEHAFIRQLSEHPRKFGFSGNTNDKAALKAWAGSQAHRLAIKAGYVDISRGHEVRIGGSGGDSAFEIGKDSTGQLKVHEYVGNHDGTFSTNEPTTKYEYESSHHVPEAFHEQIISKATGAHENLTTAASTKIPQASPTVETLSAPKAPIAEHTPRVEVKKVVAHTTEHQGTTIETSAVESTIKSSTGKEFLSKDFATKIQPDLMGGDMNKKAAMALSRNISTRMAVYDELTRAGKTEQAGKQLKMIHEIIDLEERFIGKGVIDRTKLPKLER